LASTSPHQIWLEDVGTGNALKTLGMIDPELPHPPNNYADTTTVSGYSIFELAIKLRDDLVRGDTLQTGGNDLQALDVALDNVLKNLALVGAKQRRFDELSKRIEYDISYVKELSAKTEGIDLPEAIMDLKWLETVRNYALNVGARTIRPTLIDFLR
jgi:flagellar hook-associated protein 3 FlgL